MARASGIQRNQGLTVLWGGLLTVLLIFIIPTAYAGFAQNWLSIQDHAALEQGQATDALVEFDQTEAATLAATRRQQAALLYQLPIDFII